MAFYGGQKDVYCKNELYENNKMLSLKKWKVIFCIYISIVGTVFYYFKSILHVDQFNSSIVIGDSWTYTNLALNVKNIDNIVNIFHINRNLVGPVVLLKIFNMKELYIFIFNVVILYLALSSVLKYLKSNEAIVTFFIILNPLLFVSLLVINKEILSIVGLLFLAAYILSQKKYYYFLSLLASSFARFELCAVILLFFCFKNLKKANSRIMLLIALLLIFSFYIPTINTLTSLLILSQTSHSLGITLFLDKLTSEYYLFFITCWPKIMINLFGDLFKSVADVAQGYGAFVYISEICFFVVIALNIYLKKMRIMDDIFLFIVIYMIIFSIPAFIQHRYFFPLYPLFIIMLFKKPIILLSNCSAQFTENPYLAEVG